MTTVKQVLDEKLDDDSTLRFFIDGVEVDFFYQDVDHDQQFAQAWGLNSGYKYVKVEAEVHLQKCVNLDLLNRLSQIINKLDSSSEGYGEFKELQDIIKEIETGKKVTHVAI